MSYWIRTYWECCKGQLNLVAEIMLICDMMQLGENYRIFIICEIYHAVLSVFLRYSILET